MAHGDGNDGSKKTDEAIRHAMEVMAIDQAKRGDPTRLARLVRQGEPLSQQGREVAARLIEGRAARGKGRPPKPVTPLLLRRQHLVNQVWKYSDPEFKRRYRRLTGKQLNREHIIQKVAARYWPGNFGLSSEADNTTLEAYIDRWLRNPGRYLK